MLTDTFKDHIAHPQNTGELSRWNGLGEVIGQNCGDHMIFYILVIDGCITDLRFKTFGCWAAMAGASLLTERIKGMRLEEAKKVCLEELSRDLIGLPAEKEQCVQLAVRAIKEAILNYEMGSSRHKSRFEFVEVK